MIGRPVWLDANRNAKLDRGEKYTRVRMDGTWSLSRIPLGDQVIRVSAPSGFWRTNPGGGAWSIALTSHGQRADNRNFGLSNLPIVRAVAFLEQRLPGMAGEPFLLKTCLYTMTPDRDFVVDAVPGHPSILVAQGAAHAYKFASVLGRILAELAMDGTTPSAGELEAFRIDRPILREAEPEAQFLV